MAPQNLALDFLRVRAQSSPMTHPKNAKYQAEYRARLKSRGLVQVIVWVPKSAVSRLKAYVAKLVRGADSANVQQGKQK